MKKLSAIVSTSLLLAACSEIPKEAYYNRGQPESLLSATSEKVSIPLDGKKSLADLADMLGRDAPTGAEFSCSGNKNLCKKAEKTLKSFGVSYEKVGGPNAVVLHYDKVTARDCNNRFISNHINPYNLNHPAFGCSIAVNQVQMVSDKSQFVNPKLLGRYDGTKAVQNYDSYLRPAAAAATPAAAGSTGTGSK